MRDNDVHPATVWATGNDTLATQLRDRYVGATRGDSARLSPVIARHIITTYTRPGATVLDPDAGAGIVLCEAIRVGRHAIGIHPDRWGRGVCEANLDLAQLAAPQGTVTLLAGNDDPQAATLPGAVDLVLSGLRRSSAGGSLAALAMVYETLDAVADWVWPGGHIAFVCRPERERHAVVDLPGQITDAAQAIGLTLVDHCIALSGRLVRGRRLRARASFGETRAATWYRDQGFSIALNAHLDVLVFQVPVTARTRPVR